MGLEVGGRTSDRNRPWKLAGGSSEWPGRCGKGSCERRVRGGRKWWGGRKREDKHRGNTRRRGKKEDGKVLKKKGEEADGERSSWEGVRAKARTRAKQEGPSRARAER